MDDSLPRKRTLIVSECRSDEFRPVIDWLFENTSCLCVNSVSDAMQALEERSEFDAIVLCQGHRGQFCQRDVIAIARLSPLARIVNVAGSWCEGELRTGTPLTGVGRVLAHACVPYLRRMFIGLSGALPPTASNDERWLEESKRIKTKDDGSRVVVLGNDLSLVSGIAEAFERERWTAVAARPAFDFFVSSPSLVIYDASSNLQRRKDQLKKILARFSDIPVIVLLDFPRSHEIEELIECGVSCVVAKPFRLAELLESAKRRSTKCPTGLSQSSPDALVKILFLSRI